MPGAYMKDIGNKLISLAKSGSRFETITIVAGGNDASHPSDVVNLESTVSALKSAIDAAKSLSASVILSTIPPRSTPDHAMDDIKTLNAHKQGTAQKSVVRFVHSDEHFYLRDGKISEACLYDHVHGSLEEANKFGVSLGFKKCDIGVCSFKPQQGYWYEHKSGENEGNIDIEHVFWNNVREKGQQIQKSQRSWAHWWNAPVPANWKKRTHIWFYRYSFFNILITVTSHYHGISDHRRVA